MVREFRLPDRVSAENKDSLTTHTTCKHFSTHFTSWSETQSRNGQVVREFRLPEGVSAEDMDSNGDGDLLVALDLRSDDSLARGRVARELVNRVQKLRKVPPFKQALQCRCRFPLLTALVLLWTGFRVQGLGCRVSGHWSTGTQCVGGHCAGRAARAWVGSFQG